MINATDSAAPQLYMSGVNEFGHPVILSNEGLTKREELIFRIYSQMCHKYAEAHPPWNNIARNAISAADALFYAMNKPEAPEFEE